jgi:hypothetical protein
VCVCERGCDCACLRVGRWVGGVRARGFVHARPCSLTYPAYKACVTSLTPPNFSTLSHKRHDYQEKVTSSLQLLSETFLILR